MSALMRSFFLLVGFAFAASTAAATFTVTNNADSGAGTLRQAIADANLTPTIDTIQFSLPPGSQTIALTSGLPMITAPIIVDGSSAPGFAGSPIIEVTNFGVSIQFANPSATTVIR